MTRFLLLRCLFSICLLLLSPMANGQSDAGKVAAAREIGFAGIKDYQAGKFAEASDKLERAHALVKAPTIGLWSARALVKTGRLVLAAERYLETTRMTLPATNRENHKKAQEDAAEERQALLGRIPRLQVDITGAPPNEVELKMDDIAIDSALIGVARPVDPGSHRVSASWNGQEKSEDIQLAEGAKESITLAFDAAAAPVKTPGAATSKPETSPAPATAPTPPADRASTEGSHTLAYVALGVGGAGLIVGGVTGVIAMGKKSDLDDSGSCREGKCGPEAHDDVDSLNTMRTISTVGFIVGAVGTAAGVTLLLTGSSEHEGAAAAKTELRLGPRSVSFAGTF